MLNSLKYALAAVSTLIAGGYVVSQSDSEPTSKNSPVQLQLASFDPQQLDRKVSVNINGTFGDVAKWLKAQGVNFVVADAAVSNRRIALNFKDTALVDVMDAIAEAMGGSFDRKGNAYVFHAGANSWPGMIREVPEMKNFKWDGELPQGSFKVLKDGEFLKNLPNMQNFKWDGKDMKFFKDGKEMDLKELEKNGFKVLKDGKFMKNFQVPDMKDFKWEGKPMEGFKVFTDGEFMKTLPDMKGFKWEGGKGSFFPLDGKGQNIRIWVDGKEVKPEEIKGKTLDGKKVRIEVEGLDNKIQKQIAESMKTAEKQMRLYHGQDGNRQMTEKERAAFEKEMARAHEEIAKAMKDVDHAKIQRDVAEAMKNHKGLTDKERAEMNRDIARAHEEVAKAMKDHKGLTEAQQKEIDKAMANAHKEMEKAHGEMEKAHKEIAKAKVHSESMKKLIDSITPAQWELAKKQGHLKKSDLTPEQRKLMGTMSDDGDWTISYSNDGKSLTIKNK